MYGQPPSMTLGISFLLNIILAQPPFPYCSFIETYILKNIIIESSSEPLVADCFGNYLLTT